MNHHKPNRASNIVHHVTPESAGWRYLDFQVITLAAGETFTTETATNEVGLIPLRGRAQARVADESFALARGDVFQEAGHGGCPVVAVTLRVTDHHAERDGYCSRHAPRDGPSRGA